MKKKISMLLAIVMLLSIVMVPGVFTIGASAAEGPVAIKFHYSRPDGNYEDWDLFSWGAITGSAAFVEEEGEMVATIYANANTGSVGFIVREGGDSWKGKDPDGDRFVESVYADLALVQAGTLHVYCTSGTADFTVVEGDDVVKGAAAAAEYDITIKVHYYREDGAYSDWEVHMWNGVESLDATRAFELEDVTYDGTTYGATATYYADAADSWVGFIIKKPDWTKDPDGDRKIDVSDVLNGTVHIYAKTGSALEDFVVDKSEAQVGAKVVAAVYDSITNVLTVTTAVPIEGALNGLFELEGPDGQMKIKNVTNVEGTCDYILEYDGEIDSENIYTIYYKGTPCVVTVPNVYSTEFFESEYTYEGDDLGATWTAEGTTFRLWAPTATAVSVNLYTSGTEGTDDLIESVEMTADVNGTWVATVEGDLNGTYYTYSVTRKGETVEAVDPYARTTGVNGNRGMIVDLDSTDPEGWENDTYVTQSSYTDAVIWELHVRDFSIDESSGMTNKGKYLAFTEKGTTVPGTDIATGVDYMVDLGVNYVHLLPVYDINSVDETTGGYNWGYDPENYNVPEGSYSTDPYNGEVRITEFKQMVQSLHNDGMGVIMDVVYNHTYDANSNFNKIVPYYYYRYDANGANTSASGCGNDTASERLMFRKFMVDSVSYWAEEYHLDGFRFDLMGLHDVETMQAIEKAVHAINPNAIIYGEAWNMAGNTTSATMATQPNLGKITATVGAAGAVSAFNDAIRDGLKGSVFDEKAKGYINGDYAANAAKVQFGIMGASSSTGVGWSIPGCAIINYMSAHDNNTLWDKLHLSNPDNTKEELLAMNRLGAAIMMISKGTPFWQAGEEMLRSKPNGDGTFNENSYNASDAVNNINWELLTADSDEYAMMRYYQGLIALRQEYAIFRSNGDDVTVTFENLAGGGMVAKFVASDGQEALVLINPTDKVDSFTLAGSWNLLADGTRAGSTVLQTLSGDVEIAACSVMILVK